MTQKQEQSIPKTNNIPTKIDNDIDTKSNGHSQKVSHPSQVSHNNPPEGEEEKGSDFITTNHFDKVAETEQEEKGLKNYE